MSRQTRSTHAINEQIKRTRKRKASIKHYMFGSFASAPSARTALSVDTLARVAVVVCVVAFIVKSI